MKTKHIYTAAAALMLAACSQDNALTTLGDAADSRLVTFQVQTQPTQGETRAVAPAPEALPLTGQGRQLWLMPSVTPMDASVLTRGTQINAVDALSSFGVSAYKHTAVPSGTTVNDYLANNHLKPDFFYNLEAAKVEGTEQFKLSHDYYWPATDEVLSFYAYAPYSDGTTNTSIVPSAATDEGPLSITFKVNTDLKSQVDFITASSSSTAHTDAHSVPSVRLSFAHQLTGIRFVIGNQFPAGFIKSIALKGVYTEGVYTVGGGWTLDPLKKDNFTITYQDKANTETPGEAITAADETFLMIPHEFADDDAATIEVVFNDGSTDYTVSAPLAGTTWEAGKNVTYAITSNKLTTLQIASIDFPQTISGAPKRTWQEGDVVGMYVVAADGTTIKHKNIPVTYDGSKWNINHETADGTIYRLKDETFYFYYPYSTATNNQPSGYPEACTAGADAETFFGGVISNFSVAADQSSLDDFLACDLMVAKATDEGHVSTIKAAMERQVGLAVIAPQTTSIALTRTYNSTSTLQESDEEGKYTDSGSTTVTATSVITGANQPYLYNSKLYAYTTPESTTSFNCDATQLDAWENTTVQAKLSKGENKTFEVKSRRKSKYKAWRYGYEGKVATFVAPREGNYQLEVHGASSRGNGGYSVGTMTLSAAKQLYVCVGGQGTGGNASTKTAGVGGYNGGGNGGHSANDNYAEGPGGGGATHIAQTSNLGVLKNYSATADRAKIIMVAGGGGGCCWNTNANCGHGGGESGQSCQTTAADGSIIMVTIAGGTQTTGYAFGQGQSAADATQGGGAGCEGRGGGGGGWYGGYASQSAGGSNSNAGGGGGSGYVNTSVLASGCKTEYGSHRGDGVAIITAQFEY